jgi:uncharacterized membrane protein
MVDLFAAIHCSRFKHTYFLFAQIYFISVQESSVVLEWHEQTASQYTT